MQLYRINFLFLLLVTSSCGKFSISEPAATGAQQLMTNPDLTTNMPAADFEFPLFVTGAGQLKATQELQVFAVTEFQRAWGSQDEWPLRSAYDVRTFKIDYLTPNINGELIQASGLIAIPIMPVDKQLTVLSYQHGTIFRNAEAPSMAIKAKEAPILLASLGFAVVAADYIGYGSSQGVAHPYLQSAPAATTVVDLLVAARVWFQRNHVKTNRQLILMGYSQGAHVSMAAQRHLQANPSPYLPQPTMMIGGGGPYNVKATMDGILDVVREKEPVLGALVSPNVLEHLGSSLRRRVRDAILKEIIPTDSDIVLDSRFLDLYLADRKTELESVSNVHQWSPATPIFMIHGTEDIVVPYNSSVTTLRAMQNLSGGRASVSLRQCPADASSHIGCVAPFFKFAFETIAFSGLNL